MSKDKRNRQNRPREPSVTNAQYRVIRHEVDKQILAADQEYSLNFTAGVLWVLHAEFGFGVKRLRRMWEAYRRVHDELREYYELRDDTDTCFVCREQLKRIGVDVEKWNKE